MKMLSKNLSITLAAALLAVAGASYTLPGAARWGAGAGGGGTAPLSESEIAGLQFMREEEKLARDVYAAMDEMWGMRIFW